MHLCEIRYGVAMDCGWSDSLETPQERWHGVQVYSRPEELAESVASYVAAGVAAGEPALLVLRAAHESLFFDRLDAAGWDGKVLESAGLLVLLDAEETLDALLDGDIVSASQFGQLIGGALDAVSARFPAQNVRAFGEMVDVLCERGNAAGAARLEELWNDASVTRRFTLLCGYALDVFDRDAQSGVLPDVCRAHTHVKPASDATQFDHAVETALVDVLGPTHARMVYGIVAEENGSGTPLSQHALMWVSDHMPAMSERILSTARERYAGSAEVAA